MGDEKTIFDRGTPEIKIQILESKIKDSWTRVRLAAWSELRKLEYEIPISLRRKVMGVVVELAEYDGINYLAVYEDHHARYYSYDGQKVIWEGDDKVINPMIDKLIKTGQEAAYKLELWTGNRKKGVKNDMVRITYLTPSGIYFTEGPVPTILQDSKAKPVLEQAMELIKALQHKNEGHGK